MVITEVVDTLQVFDTRTMSISHNFPRKQYIQMCCDVSSDGKYCLILYRLFDTRTMSISHNFPRKQYIQMCCDVSSAGYY